MQYKGDLCSGANRNMTNAINIRNARKTVTQIGDVLSNDWHVGWLSRLVSVSRRHLYSKDLSSLAWLQPKFK